MEIFQYQIFERSLIVKTSCSNLTRECNSLEECCIAFLLNCNFAHEKYAADFHDELSSEFHSPRTHKF